MTVQAVQAWLRSIIGAFHIDGRIRSIAVEFGAEGYGVFRVAWDGPKGRIRRKAYEFDSAAELAAIVTGKRPPPWTKARNAA